MKRISRLGFVVFVAVVTGCATFHKELPQPTRIDIQILPDKTLQMNGDRFAIGDLQSRMKALHVAEPKTMPVFITQPREMPRETMRLVFDELSLAGFLTLKGGDR
jgi:biopolymer transport protein ExbD